MKYMETKQEKLITLATYSSITDAYIFKNILDMKGIECFVTDSNASLSPSVPFLHEGGVRLAVRERDAAKAISALNKAQLEE
jgi:hypothetical protein